MTDADHSITRRDAVLLPMFWSAALTTLGCSPNERDSTVADNHLAGPATTINKSDTQRRETMRVHYLEIVTNEVDTACEIYSEIHSVAFGDADPSLGGARTAKMKNGGILGVRAPMHDGEKSVTRAYMLVEDIDAAVAAAKKSGAEIAVPPMEIPGHGKCAIYFQDGIEAGLWQL